MSETLKIDVTKLEPHMKHSVIFGNIERLAQGESLIIHNDHDPVPLKFRLNDEYPDQFTVEYLQSGPSVWELLVTRKGESFNALSVGEIVALDNRMAQFFDEKGIDFCCAGKVNVAYACKKAGITVEEVEKKYNSLDKSQLSPETDFNNFSLTKLVDHIINTHHTYINKNIGQLVAYSAKIAQVHGDLHPELKEVAELVKTIADDIEIHLHKEEELLFPAIRELDNTGILNTCDSCFLNITGPMATMEYDHENLGDMLHKIVKLTNNYTLPAGACTTYQLTFKKLQEFEKDIHQHVHLENNILFPKAAKQFQDAEVEEDENGFSGCNGSCHS